MTSRRVGGGLALVAFGAYAVFFYRDVLLADRVYIFRDLYTLFYSTEHVARRLSQWTWPPLWNPFPMLGRPFAADPLAGVYYPPNWLLRLLPVATGFNLSLVLHHTWAAWGACLLGRELRLPLRAALLAGLLYGFAGPLVSCDNLYNGLLAAAWGPWIALAFVRWCDRPSLVTLAAVVLALAMSMLGAMPEFTLFANVVLFALALDRRRAGGAGAVARAAAAIAVANVLAMGLCAVQLIPSAELIAQSSRAAGLNLANALQHSLRPSGALGFVVAGADATAATTEAPWLLSLYFGPILLLSALALVRLPRRCRWWAALAALFLLLALGEHLPGYAWLLERVPRLRLVRYPEKFLLVVHALFAFAAAAGLEAMLEMTDRRRPQFAGVIAAAVLLLTAADLYRANARLLPSARWSEVVEPPYSAQRMERDDDPLRIYSNGIGLPVLPAYPEGFLLEKDLLLMATANLYDIANANAPMTINLVDHERLEQLVENVARERVAGILGLFNTAYVTSARALEYPGFSDLRTPSTPLEAFVYRVEPLAPRAFVPQRVRIAATPEEALEHLRHAEAPAQEVVLEDAALPPDSPAAMEGTVTLRRYLGDRVDLDVSMETPGFVVLGDTFYRGWTASVDGEPAPVVRANHFARAVFVAAGGHHVAFDYAPTSHRLGLGLSLAVGLALGVGVAARWSPVHSLRLRRRQSS